MTNGYVANVAQGQWSFLSFKSENYQERTAAVSETVLFLLFKHVLLFSLFINCAFGKILYRWLSLKAI